MVLWRSEMLTGGDAEGSARHGDARAGIEAARQVARKGRRVLR